MSCLLLRLAAPLQSWGTSSRFTRRNTDRAPSRSGVLGLLAAATGRRRTDPLEELLDLRIGVRIEQPGRLERDFQTARSRDGQISMPLSYRFYLADAVFAVAVHGPDQLLETVEQALRAPAFPLYLGRRSCPPAGVLLHGMHDGDLAQVLAEAPWLASPWVQKQHRAPMVTLDTVADCPATEPRAELVRDEPVSFDPRHRQYDWRTVLSSQVTVPNPLHRSPTPIPAAAFAGGGHDPMAVFEEPI
ncbi:type I-E CRISPR-associated protein Cas5/CasD [Crossiella sp. CA-258035]|uniref:type I-E CRISPR-associated protein Cas5/CasD n=1 Tax=Crossiella sp. CA-258035 TaxID=2981138 RepID=UPI0024BC2E0C|nr:type I-E CRISPR-associated protein Cas5/CasD [Crossiella sp. CA-258035]WHT23391.1 type I-E CRISPR-associated protein Cas5/CasD [Crossiella sp. CA-258035]